MLETTEGHEAPVFSYVMASADMRYIEIGRREVFLRKDPTAGLVIRGEIPDCGPECFIDLSEILLEYATSCEGCREDDVDTEEVVTFGVKLGEILVASTADAVAELPTPKKLSIAFACTLNSMGATYRQVIKENCLEYMLDCCPLRECANSTGFGRNVEMAQLSFTAMCKSIVNAFAPDWELTQPSEGDTSVPIHQIVISYGRPKTK